MNYGIDLLRQEPAGTRRVLVLLSQPQDDGSKVHADEIVQRLGETNTMIYSVTFSPEKTWLKDQFTQERHENAPYMLSPDLPPLLHTFNLDEPARVALRAMRENTAAEIATLSGGESLPFGDRGEFDRQLSVLANHIPNRYTLTFQPTSDEPGFHAIRVQVISVQGIHQSIPVTVTAQRKLLGDRAVPVAACHCGHAAVTAARALTAARRRSPGRRPCAALRRRRTTGR